MSEEMSQAVEKFGISCDECGKIEYDYKAYEEHWFHVIIPHRDIEKMDAVTFCMPCGDFCSIGCFSGFGDKLVRLRLFGTDRIPMIAPREEHDKPVIAAAVGSVREEMAKEHADLPKQPAPTPEEVADRRKQRHDAER